MIIATDLYSLTHRDPLLVWPMALLKKLAECSFPNLIPSKISQMTKKTILWENR